MMAPLLSIITVVRDDLPGLLATRASLRAQAGGLHEWIVVDGGSRDGTAEWLTAHGHEAAWWRSAPDGGVYDAMNVGLAAARGDFVWFLNAGDRLAFPDTLAAVADSLRANPNADLLYGDSLEVSTDGRTRLKPARSHRFSFYGMFTHHQAMAYRRSAVANLRFETRFPIGADYAFTLNALAGSRSIERVRYPLCVFVAGGLANRMAAAGRRDQTRIRSEILRFGPLRCLAISAVQQAAWALRTGIPLVYDALRWRRAENGADWG